MPSQHHGKAKAKAKAAKAKAKSITTKARARATAKGKAPNAQKVQALESQPNHGECYDGTHHLGIAAGSDSAHISIAAKKKADRHKAGFHRNMYISVLHHCI